MNHYLPGTRVLDRLNAQLKREGAAWMTVGEMPDEAIRLTARMEGRATDSGVRVLRLVSRQDGSAFVENR